MENRFKQNVAVVTIGYNKFAIPDPQLALELMAVLSKAVSLSDSLYSVRKFTEAEYCLAEEPIQPELKWVRVDKIDGHRTVDEIKQQGEAAEKAREDMEGGVLVPAPLELTHED